MPSDSRVAAVDHFTPTLHSTPHPSIDPSTTSLKRPFTACIIGASRGIGAGIARAYARAGASTLVLAARSLPALHGVADSLRHMGTHINVHVHACDVSSAESVAALAAFVKESCGALNVLVLNSGVSGQIDLKVTEGDAAAWGQVFGVNALGTFYCARSFVPLLLETRGGAKAFAVVSSLAACIVQGSIANTKYCVSKMAQARIVEHVAEQYREEGLAAFAVHPGAVKTEMALDSAPESVLKWLTDDPDLCGAFMVWLTKEPEKTRWLSGRLVSATWDVEELLAKKDEIVEKDLLKFEVKTA